MKLSKNLRSALPFALLVGSTIVGGVATSPWAGAQTLPRTTAAQGPFTFPAPAITSSFRIAGGSDATTSASFNATRPPGINTPSTLAEGNVLEPVGPELLARGTQDYVCRLNASGAPAWAFTGPRANLYAPNYRTAGGTFLVGDHYNLQGTASANTPYNGPRWRLSFTGQVLIGRVAVSAPGRTPGDIPWLLLRAEVDPQFSDGSDAPEATTFITRTDTVGGVAPAASSCGSQNLGAVAQVPYSAAYNFYRPNQMARCNSEYPAPYFCPNISLGG
jgi:Protein of unknown function (DUF3455)